MATPAHAELLRPAESAEVSDVVFDVDFLHPLHAGSDQAFLTLRAAGGSVMLPSFSSPAPTEPPISIAL